MLRDVIVLGVGMWQVITGHGAGRLTIGSFIAFSTYVNLYEQGFSSMANIWINLRQVLVSAGRFLRGGPPAGRRRGHRRAAGHVEC